ncbi:MAG: hypothetical protein ACE15F_24395 [bacterium]
MSAVLAGAETTETPNWLPRMFLEQVREITELSENELRLDPVRMRFASSFELQPFHEMLTGSPLSAPPMVHRLAVNLIQSATRLSDLAGNLSILAGRRTGTTDTTTWSEMPPALDEFRQACQKAFPGMADSGAGGETRRVESFFQSLPPEGRIFTYSLFQTLAASLPRLRAGRESLTRMAPFSRWEQVIRGREDEGIPVNLLRVVHRQGDWVSLYQAGAEILCFLDEAMKNVHRLDREWPSLKLTWPSPWGLIVISGKDNDIHEYPEPPLLLLDLGGDDTYLGQYAQTDEGHPVSLVLDLGGCDRYVSEGEGLGAGSAVLGVSVLIDLGEGDDRYSGKSHCFGYAFGGVAVLFNEKGGTSYEADSFSLGAAEMGLAALVDGSGGDTYRTLHSSQGYGGMGGAGLLADVAGNDAYIAAATPVVIPSAQLPGRNFSAAQGYGTGRFGPNLDGQSLPGGIGILLDGAGDDHYEACVFAQGAGYGFGAGILADLDGNDTYQADWYAMGAGAHQGAGLLIDGGGADAYSVSQYMGCGAGTDLALGILWDEEGNDTYQARNASLGCGYTNAFGLLVDSSGDDRYSLEDRLGAGAAFNDRPATLRGLWPTLGLFFDLGGTDAYRLPSGHDNGVWSNDPENNPGLYGVGVDGNGI